MARPRKETPPKKEHCIGIRLTDDLFEVLSGNAEKAGLSLSAYIRQFIAGKTPKAQPPIFHDDTAMVSELAKLNKLGSNLNKIAW